MNPKLTFEQLCPQWSEKFKKTEKTETCELEMDCYPTCALGEAYGLRDLVRAKTDDSTLSIIPRDKKYYSIASSNHCRFCEKMADEFDFAYDSDNLTRIDQLKTQLVEHFVEKHQDVLKERGLL